MASAIPTGKSFLELRQAADEGDGTAIAELAKIGNNLGKGLANLINVLNPQLIVLGGDVVHAGKWVMTPCRSTLQERVWPWVWERNPCGIFRPQFRTGGLDAKHYRRYYQGDRTFVSIAL